MPRQPNFTSSVVIAWRLGGTGHAARPCAPDWQTRSATHGSYASRSSPICRWRREPAHSHRTEQEMAVVLSGRAAAPLHLSPCRQWLRILPRSAPQFSSHTSRCPSGVHNATWSSSSLESCLRVPQLYLPAAQHVCEACTVVRSMKGMSADTMYLLLAI